VGRSCIFSPIVAQFTERQEEDHVAHNSNPFLHEGRGSDLPKHRRKQSAGGDRGLPAVRVLLRPEPNNPHDANAIAVDRENGEQLGYLPAPLAKEVNQRERLGYQHAVFVRNVFRREAAFPYLGVELAVIRATAETTPAEIQRYIDHRVGYRKAGATPVGTDERGPSS
jgi:hypothetical protein